jgi:hypothetical protein
LVDRDNEAQPLPSGFYFALWFRLLFAFANISWNHFAVLPINKGRSGNASARPRADPAERGRTVRRNSKGKDAKRNAPGATRIQSAHSDPVRVVERVLTRPDGTTTKVRVPVYPPFELAKRSPVKTAKPQKMRKTG